MGSDAFKEHMRNDYPDPKADLYKGAPNSDRPIGSDVAFGDGPVGQDVP